LSSLAREVEVMKKRLVATGLLMSLAATGAAADNWHLATAPTKKEAMRLATADARVTAQRTHLCYRPAAQIDQCVKVDGGFRCRADSAERVGVCYRRGWVSNAETPLLAREASFDGHRLNWIHEPVQPPPTPTSFPNQN